MSDEQTRGLKNLGGGLFWDITQGTATLPEHQDFIIQRVLSRGTLDQISWLRENIGDAAIRQYLRKTRGRALDKKRLRFLSVIVDLPGEEVTNWFEELSRQIWDNR